MYKLGIDVGSTTVKLVVINQLNDIIFKSYQRHHAKIKETIINGLLDLNKELKDVPFKVVMTGSAAVGLAKQLNVEFVQEVIASTNAIKTMMPSVDVVIELGGEDAKIIYLTNGVEQRMNGSCAGGTGAFIDQMATLMNVDIEDMDALASKHQKLYPIASRCGVFAKTDVQPLLNQGAQKEDIAASIFQAIVNQTITGLAQGRMIEGKVAFLGGPLSFMPHLRVRFMETLKLLDQDVYYPEDAKYFVALGCALSAHDEKSYDAKTLIKMLQAPEKFEDQVQRLEPLFESEQDYTAFKERHALDAIKTIDFDTYQGNAYLGIDAGSTTTKMILITEQQELLYEFYHSNQGNPVNVIQHELTDLMKRCDANGINIVYSGVTGYGEELIKNAFGIDFGVVETMAHYKAANFFNPQVDYIIDIGGQDMKCFKIKNNTVDSMMINEACSSGCGSFIETFANAMSHTAKTFASEALFAKQPVDLGSRCTVFMNSSVKQAQKEGASVGDISAGLAISVVKNALYKVIRVTSASDLGEQVVVQGGTFYNDAILRAFERELGVHVVRPNISGLMGAFGCALMAKERADEKTNLMTQVELSKFEHTSTMTNCQLCGNNCTLTVNHFGGNKRFISGNKCERGAGIKLTKAHLPNLVDEKYKMLYDLEVCDGKNGEIGIPMVLNFFDNYPFWNTFFNALDIKCVLSNRSSKQLFELGQTTIPSDTVCYPAKLVHGHIIDLIDRGVNKIFYPIMPYNVREKEHPDNHYNCPVVAYYPELIEANVDRIKEVDYLSTYFAFMNPHFHKQAYKHFKEYFPMITPKQVKQAVKKGMQAYETFRSEIQVKGEMALAFAKETNTLTICLSGRPYHIDPEINHGIDRLITTLGCAVVTEDSIAHLADSGQVNVLNQWTYHARLYDAAKVVIENQNMQLLQLVSFGCGLDAITGDEVRRQLEENNKFYTQIKIDDISNLGAAKIRIRSLIAAVEAERETWQN